MQVLKTAIRSQRPPRRFGGCAAAWILLASLVVLCPYAAIAGETNPYWNPAWSSEKQTVARLGESRITVLEVYAWRDWMPIVKNPGPDGGSPLRVRIKLKLDNARGETNRLSFHAVIIDGREQSYPVTFRSLPDAHQFTDTNKKSAALREGTLPAGEIRVIDLLADQGPYLPAGSEIYIRMEWTDSAGQTAVIRTPAQPVKRTD
ncbi:MAG: hypothetical protein EG826_14030 [Deltaproteobacteria bacterium]|nr:hypothetical protein [Deltaproteobacteria bacterium]